MKQKESDLHASKEAVELNKNIYTITDYFKRSAITDLECFYLLHLIIRNLWIGKATSLLIENSNSVDVTVGKIELWESEAYYNYFNSKELTNFLLELNQVVEFLKMGVITENESYNQIIYIYPEKWAGKVSAIEIPEEAEDEETFERINLQMKMVHFDLLNAKGNKPELKDKIIDLANKMAARIESDMDGIGRTEQAEIDYSREQFVKSKISYVKNLCKQLGEESDNVRFISITGLIIQIVSTLPGFKLAIFKQ